MEEARAGIGGVRNDGGEGGAQDLRDVLLRGNGVDHPRRAAFGGEQVKEGVEGVLPPVPGDLGEGHAFIGGVLRRSEPRGPDVLKAHEKGDVLKVRARLHPPSDGRPRFAIPQPCRQGLQPPGVALRRQHVDELGGPGAVGIDIAGDIQPLRPGRFDGPEHVRHRPPPVPAADGLQVADLHRGLQGPGHPQHLGKGRLHAVPLLAHVDGDHHPAPAEGGEEGDELLGGLIALRRVAETQGHPQRPVREGPAQGGLDGGGLRRREGAGAEARGVRPQGPHADELPGVEGQGGALPEVLPHRGEAQLPGVPGDGGEIAADLLPVRPRQGRGGKAAVPVHDGGEALAELPVPEVRGKHRQVGVAVDVQEARRQRPAPGVDALPRRRLPQVPDGGDLPAEDAHIGGNRRPPAAVDDPGVYDLGIQHAMLPPAAPGRHEMLRFRPYPSTRRPFLQRIPAISTLPALDRVIVYRYNVAENTGKAALRRPARENTKERIERL